MRIRKLMVLNLALLATIPAVANDDDLRFGAADQARVVESTKWLEENPLDDGADKLRGELITWWVEVPDLALEFCSAGFLDASNEKVKPIVVTQMMIGTGAFVIENPGADQKAATLAGVASGLRTYQAIISIKKKFKDKLYTNFLELMNTGNLEDALEEEIQECFALPPTE